MNASYLRRHHRLTLKLLLCLGSRDTNVSTNATGRVVKGCVYYIDVKPVKERFHRHQLQIPSPDGGYILLLEVALVHLRVTNVGTFRAGPEELL